MNQEKVLIFTFDMLPNAFAFGGCQRMYFLMETLRQEYEFHVIHAMHSQKNNFGKNIFFHSYPVEYPILIKKMLGIVLGAADNDLAKKAPQTSFFKQLIGKILAFSSKWVEKIFYNEIIIGTGILGKIFLIKSKKTILEVIDNHAIKKVIISGPPFVLFQAIPWLIKKRPEVQIIMDYRDPWNLWNNKKLGLPVLKEKKYLTKSRYITVFSQQYKDDLVQKYALSEKKIHVVMNGYSESSWQEIIHKPVDRISESKIVISYVGTISFQKNSFRNPAVFLEAFENFDHKDQFLLRFIGVNLNDPVVMNFKKGLGNNIEFIGRINQTDSLLELLRSDVLVLFHSHQDESNKYIFNGKFFDYLKSEKFLIGIGDENVLFNQMINKLQLGLTSINNKEKIIQLFEKLLELKKNNQLYPKKLEQLNYYSREYQNTQIRDLLKQI